MSKYFLTALAMVASVMLLAIACGGEAEETEEAEVVIVQAPGTKSEADEQARLAARPAGWLAEARIDHAAVLLQDGRLLVTGGKGIVKYPRGSLTDTAELFDPELLDWVLTSPMPMAREYHRSVLLEDGRVLVMGCLLYTSPSPRDGLLSRMPSSA